MTIYEIIRKPIITEKSEELRREFNKYTFEVDRRANKIEIKNAIEKVFDVKVLDIATQNIRSISKRHRMTMYKTSAKKKAIVKLAEGNTIPYFQNV